jgi:hypothetical protein
VLVGKQDCIGRRIPVQENPDQPIHLFAKHEPGLAQRK